MRTRNFELPADLITEFAKLMEKHELDNVIEGVTEDGEIQISVDYEADEKKIIERIHDMIDRYHDDEEEEEDENDEEDEDEDDEDNDDDDINLKYYRSKRRLSGSK